MDGAHGPDSGGDEVGSANTSVGRTEHGDGRSKGAQRRRDGQQAGQATGRQTVQYAGAVVHGCCVVSCALAGVLRSDFRYGYRCVRCSLDRRWKLDRHLPSSYSFRRPVASPSVARRGGRTITARVETGAATVADLDDIGLVVAERFFHFLGG